MNPEEITKLVTDYMTSIGCTDHLSPLDQTKTLIDSHKRMREDNQVQGKLWKEMSLWRRFLISPSTGWTLIRMDLHSKRVSLGFYIGSIIAGEDITHT